MLISWTFWARSSEIAKTIFFQKSLDIIFYVIIFKRKDYKYATFIPYVIIILNNPTFHS